MRLLVEARRIARKVVLLPRFTAGTPRPFSAKRGRWTRAARPDGVRKARMARCKFAVTVVQSGSVAAAGHTPSGPRISVRGPRRTTGVFRRPMARRTTGVFRRPMARRTTGVFRRPMAPPPGRARGQALAQQSWGRKAPPRPADQIFGAPPAARAPCPTNSRDPLPEPHETMTPNSFDTGPALVRVA